MSGELVAWECERSLVSVDEVTRRYALICRSRTFVRRATSRRRVPYPACRTRLGMDLKRMAPTEMLRLEWPQPALRRAA